MVHRSPWEFWCEPAEREGFEPAVRVTVHGISSAAPSASRSPLRCPILPREKRFGPVERDPSEGSPLVGRGPRAGGSRAREILPGRASDFQSPRADEPETGAM